MANRDKAIRIVIGTEADTSGFRELDKAASMGLAGVESFADSMTAAFKGVSNEAERSAKDTERAFRALGIQSSDSVEKQINALREAYEKLRTSGTTSAEDLARAEEALNQKIEKLNGSLRTHAAETGAAFKSLSGDADQSARSIEAAFRKLGVQSTASIEAQVQELRDAYEMLRQSGTASAEDLARAEETLNQRIEKLTGSIRKQASEFEPLDSLAAQTESAFADLATEAERSANELDAAFKTLGIKSTKEVERQINELRQAYEALRQSGTVSAEDIARAEVELDRKIEKLTGSIKDQKRASDTALDEYERDAKATAASLEKAQGAARGFGGAIRGLVAQAAAIYGISEAVRGVGRAFVSAEQGAYALDAAIRAARGANVGNLDQWEKEIERVSKAALRYSKGELKQAAATIILQTRNIGLTFDEQAKVFARLPDLVAGSGQDLIVAAGEISSALRGEAEAAEKYGLTLNQDFVQAQYAAASASGKLWKELTDGEKAMYRLELLSKQTSGQVGNAARSLDTLEGAWSFFVARLSDGIAENKELADVLKDVAETLAENADEVAAFVSQIVSAVAEAAKFTAENKNLVGIVAGAGGTIFAMNALAGAAGLLATAYKAIKTVAVAASLSSLGSAASGAIAGVSGLSGAVTALSTTLVGPAGLVVAVGVALSILAKLIEAHIETKRVIEESYQAQKLGYEQAGKNYLQLGKNLQAINEKYGTHLQLNKEGLIVMSEQDKAILRQAGVLGKLGKAIDETSGRTPTITPKVDSEQAEQDLKELAKPEHKKLIIDVVGPNRELPSGSYNFLKLEDGATPEGFASGGYVRRRGFLPGFGGGDRIPALLEAGEYILDKFTTRALGVDALRRLQASARRSFSMPRVPASPVQRFSSGGLVNTPTALPYLGRVELGIGNTTVNSYMDKDAVNAVSRELALQKRRRSSS